MISLQEKIHGVDDKTAVRVVKVIAKAQLRTGIFQEKWQPDMHQALVREFYLTEVPAASEEGDLARQALLVLAENPQYAEAIDALIKAPTDAKRFLGAVETVALVTAVLVVLQTHVRFERKGDGKWSLKVEKKPTSDALLKSLVQKLLAYMGSEPSSGS